jgi:hypothetical protein
VSGLGGRDCSIELEAIRTWAGVKVELMNDNDFGRGREKGKDFSLVTNPIMVDWILIHDHLIQKCAALVFCFTEHKMKLTGSILLCKDVVVFGAEECVRSGCSDIKHNIK